MKHLGTGAEPPISPQMERQDRERAEKLERLRQDIRDGLNSGEATLWDFEAFKREARARS
jgi:antitoxin ParD1/3/4